MTAGGRRTNGERAAPIVSARTAAFWSGGADGALLIQRCPACGRLQHPPKAMCASCLGRDLEAARVSGQGTVWSYTISRIAWGELQPPYVVAQIELAEQPGLVLLATVVGTDEIEIGMRVRVDFERAGDAWVPVFRRQEDA